MMTFEEFVADCFIEHHNCMGMDLEEAQDLAEELTHNEMKIWLERQGYSVTQDYFASTAE